MASWAELEAQEPAFAGRVRERLEAYRHKTIATLRRDGSPRISGIEAEIADGELCFGSMPEARKADDLRRDPRLALHSGSEDPPGWKGDAKLSGRARELTDRATIERLARANGHEPPSEASHIYVVDIVEVSIVCLGEPADHLVIEHWHEDRGLRRTRRD